ncbi:MAG: hypothetical protein ABSA43_02120 [Candidatus Microgenomates bacterium]|jgi:hypothetical protein
MDAIPPDISKLANQSTKMTGGLNDLEEAKEEAEATKPLVTVSVNNPLAWLMKVINKLKKKQTTTVTFRLGVPLIALPVIIAAIAGVFYGLGKATPSPTPIPSILPTPYQISKVGILKLKADASYVLILPQGNTLSLTLPQNSDLTNMNNKRVLVTGMFNQQQNVLTVGNSSDIELLKPIPSTTPILPSPSPTPSVIPTETPIMTTPTPAV